MSFRYASAEKQKKHDDAISALHAEFKRLKEASPHLPYWEGDIGEALSRYQDARNVCPECGSKSTRMENYSMMWHEGDIVCNDCDTYVRGFDAG